MSLGRKVTKKEILNYLEVISSELTDAYNTAQDTAENSDSMYYINTAEELVNELRTNLEEEGKFVPHPSHEGGAS